MIETSYKDYVQALLEDSKNDPIPELSRDKQKLGVILFGPPAAGKTTFTRMYIGANYTKALPPEEVKRIRQNRQREFHSHAAMDHAQSYILTPSGNQFKVINSDDINLMRTGSEQIYWKSSRELRDRVVVRTVEAGRNLIFDTTGGKPQYVVEAYQVMRKAGYKVIFIQLLADMLTGMKRNHSRDRTVDLDYLQSAYKDIPTKIELYAGLGPNTYYFVQHNGAKYVFYKYERGQYYQRDERGTYAACDNPVEALLGVDAGSLATVQDWLAQNRDTAVYQEERPEMTRLERLNARREQAARAAAGNEA